MRFVIHKFDLQPQGWISITMPAGAKIIKIGGPRNKPVLWAIVDPDPDHPQETRRFRILLTGEKFDGAGTYLGTFLLYKGDFVGHLFELHQT